MVYEGPRLVAEYNASSGALVRRYVHGPGTDEPIVWYEGSGTTDRRWLHDDDHGSVIAVTNASGGVNETHTYGGYGEQSGWSGSRHAYTGQLMLAEVHLYFYKARVYDPEAGRFLQTDPIRYDGGQNLYAYASEDPIDLSDPMGNVSALSDMVGSSSRGTGNSLPRIAVASPHAGTYLTADLGAQAVQSDIPKGASVEYGAYITHDTMGPVTGEPYGPGSTGIDLYKYQQLYTSKNHDAVSLGAVPSNADAWVHNHPSDFDPGLNAANIYPSPENNNGGHGDWYYAHLVQRKTPWFSTYIVGPDNVLRNFGRSDQESRVVK